MKYNKIYKVTLVNIEDKTKYENQFILTYDYCDSDFEIDLKADLMFNTEYIIINRKFACEVHDIKDLLGFISRNKIDIPTESVDLKNEIFWVGGELDYGLAFKDLERLGWIKWEMRKEN